MEQKIFKYLNAYDLGLYENENRINFPAASTKIDYICSAINRNGSDVEIVSISWTLNKGGFYFGHKSKLSAHVMLTSFSTFGCNSKLSKFLSERWMQIQLFIYLLINTKKGEIIFCYHNLASMKTVEIAKYFKRFQLILEVEEIYTQVRISKYWAKKEVPFFKIADKYIFSTEMLNEKLNIQAKPHLINYGTYNYERTRDCHFYDDRIHVAYAGTFNKIKGGVYAAINSSLFLSKKYHMHIIGFGNDEEISSVKELIGKNRNQTECHITYDGFLKGEEYIKFLQCCNIGISTQIPSGEYNDTSFPSKIFSYLSNGLRVVSIRIKVVELSAIGDSIVYYENQTANEIANAIMSIDMNTFYDGVKLVKKLDEEFVKNIRLFLES